MSKVDNQNKVLPNIWPLGFLQILLKYFKYDCFKCVKLCSINPSNHLKNSHIVILSFIVSSSVIFVVVLKMQLLAAKNYML